MWLLLNHYRSPGWQPVQGLPQPPDGQSQLDEPPLREVHQAQRRKGGLHVRQEESGAAAESLWSAGDREDLCSWLPEQVKCLR